MPGRPAGARSTSTAKVWTIPGDAHEGREESTDFTVRRGTQRCSGRCTKSAHSRLRLSRPAAEALSDKIMMLTLRRMGRGNITTHGFRSTFRDWAAERTISREKLSRWRLPCGQQQGRGRIRRGDLFEKRRRLMESWADFCGRPTECGEVVAIDERRS